MTVELKLEIEETAPRLDEGVDILEYLGAIFAAKFLIVFLALIFGGIALGYSYTKPVLYESFVRVNLVDLEDPGGVSPDNRRASEVLTLVEHGFVLGTTKDNYLEVILAKLRSRQFGLAFIEKHNLYREFFPNQWIQEEQRWVEGFEPNKAAAFTLFNQSIRTIEHDNENDIISIHMRWNNPAMVKAWANAYVRDFNHFMRDQALAEVERKKAFLEAELQKTGVIDIRQSIFRLIEAQTAVAMLASSKEEYVLETIDPALLPFGRFSPNRKSYLIAGTFAGAMLSLSFICGRLMLRKFLYAFKRYQLHVPAQTQQ